MVTALMQASSGKVAGSMTSRSITTEVSSNPCFVSATWLDVLIHAPVEVLA